MFRGFRDKGLRLPPYENGLLAMLMDSDGCLGLGDSEMWGFSAKALSAGLWFYVNRMPGQ